MNGADGRAAPLLPAVDRAAFAAALVDRLRTRGVRTGPAEAADLVRALAAGCAADRTGLYWTARICLVRHHDDLPAFEEVFAAVFGDAVLGLDPHARRSAPGSAARGRDRPARMPPGAPVDAPGRDGLPWVTRPAAVAAAETAGEHARGVPERLPSALAGLLDTPFEQLEPPDAAALGARLEAALRVWPTRRSRRLAPRKDGARLLPRATLARARRTGFEMVRPVYAGPVPRPRRVVMLCDVSRSMQPYAVAYLHVMRALAVAAPGAEVFAFATAPTRLTAVLGHRSATAAVAGASEQVADRFGGTRIAGCLREVLASHHGGLLRGAVVIVGSDGWDADPPERLGAAAARLRRRAHRVIWLNPRADAPGYVPGTAAMRAALPHVDALLPGGTFTSLLRAVDEIRAASWGARRPPAPAGR
ncbi:VWA domain-containing protein [Streptomyces sp. NPDC050560]|uniref:VWA domain-containing protein n=1 Tax=Streptomyces sp. NPDC050560 TaxID=3365630 RepID=UPI0037943AD0